MAAPGEEYCIVAVSFNQYVNIKSEPEPAVILGSVRFTVEGEHSGEGLLITTTGGPASLMIVKLADAAEVQPAEFVTVTL
jgi:hypothetical protein